MSTVHLAVVAATVLANAAIVIADLARASFVLNNSAEVGVPASWLPLLATLKAAGCVGLVLGTAVFPPLAVAAAAGLVGFFVCAVAAHVRARVLYNIAFPGAYLALAVASLAFAITDV